MTQKRTFETLQEFADCVGQDIGVGEWTPITREMVQRFADATGDHQWIHLDEERAKSGPFGHTIAHGFLTLSLLPMLSQAMVDVRQVRMSVNYGLNRVRFMNPVPVGARVRLHLKLLSAEPVPGDGMQFVMQASFELEGADKPACVAETVSRRYA